MADHMFEVYWNDMKGWGKPKIVPFHNLDLSPMNSTLHYAFEGFEGMKAYKDAKGNTRTFRPLMNAERLNRTSAELTFPTFDPNEFVKCLDTLLKIDARWVPSYPLSLYVRPSVISMTNKLGVKSPSDTMLFIISSPSGPYFKTSVRPIRLHVETKAARTWPGGSGEKKIGANYIMGHKIVEQSIKKGYDQVLWLNGKYISEMGGCNFFIYWTNAKGEKELVTPYLDGTLLPGITRDSILSLMKTDKRFITSERPIEIPEVIRASKEKRVSIILIIWNIDYRNLSDWNSSCNSSCWITYY